MIRSVFFVILAYSVSFAAAPTFKLTVLPTGYLFAAGDVDKDGMCDIICTGSPGLFWLKYPALQKYTIASSGDYAMEIQSGDVDNDGDVDVVSPVPGDSKLYWFENPLPASSPASGAWKRHEIGSWGKDYPHDMKVGDFNGDGKLDAVVEPNVNGPCYVFIQKSPLSWTRVDIGMPALRSTEGSWVADINKDGRDDFVNGMDWYEAPADPITGTWIRHKICDFASKMIRTAVADMNGDKRPDVLVAPSEYKVAPFAWYEAPADLQNGTWKEHIVHKAGDLNYHTLQAGDVDRDGSMDVVVGTTHGPNDTAKIMRIHFNYSGTGLNLKDTTWNVKDGVWQGILRDIGSDGDLDILSADYSKGQPEFWQNQLCDRNGCATGVLFSRAARQPPIAASFSSPAGAAFDIRGRLVARPFANGLTVVAAVPQARATQNQLLMLIVGSGH